MRPFHPYSQSRDFSSRNRRLPATIGSLCPSTGFRSRRRKAGFTLVETVVSLLIIVVGLAGLFASSAQSFTLLRRSKEVVAVREDLLARLDGVRALSYAQIARTDYLKGTFMPSGAGGDATTFSVTTTGIKNFTETVTVYGLGAQLFSSDTDRNAATPDWKDQYASQFADYAPSAPTTYRATSTTQGAWVQQSGVGNTLPYTQVTRTGTGASAVTTVVTAGDLTTDPRISQLLVDVAYTWTDSRNNTHSQVGCLIVARNGSLQ